PAGGVPPDRPARHRRPGRAPVPRVGAAKPVGDDVRRRPEAAALQLRQRRLEHAEVAVVEGDADEPALAPGPHRLDERADADPPQAAALEPVNLLSGPARRHSQQVPLPPHPGHAVVHQDHRRLTQAELAALHPAVGAGDAGGRARPLHVLPCARLRGAPLRLAHWSPPNRPRIDAESVRPRMTTSSHGDQYSMYWLSKRARSEIHLAPLKPPT